MSKEERIRKFRIQLEGHKKYIDKLKDQLTSHDINFGTYETSIRCEVYRWSQVLHNTLSVEQYYDGVKDQDQPSTPKLKT